MDFNTWLDTFIEEKGIDLEAAFEFESSNGWNYMPYGVVVEAIKGTDTQMQKLIKNKIVQIDFLNGDVLHFFRHLGAAVAATY